MSKKSTKKPLKLSRYVTPDLQPADPKYIQHLQEHRPIYLIQCDALFIPIFSHVLRDELQAFLGLAEIQLIESLVRLHDFGNPSEMRIQRDGLRDELRQNGMTQNKGKRPALGLSELVSELTPVLLALGLPLAFSERSKMVTVLRLIAEELQILGDPRHELRRLKRIDSAARHGMKQAILQAVLKGLQPLTIPKTTPP